MAATRRFSGEDEPPRDNEAAPSLETLFSGETRGGKIHQRYSDNLAPRDLPEQGPRHSRLACDFIDAFLATEVRLNDLVALTGLSQASFARGFKRATGLPPTST